MSNNMLTAGVRTTPKGKRPSGVTLEALTTGWVLHKRNGRTEHFDVGKVRSAVSRCLVNSLKLSKHEAATIAERISTRVVNFMAAQGVTSPTVEDVQRCVIHQLWADGQAEAAEQYTLYREERRKMRAARPIPAEVVQQIRDDAKYFPTQLQAYQFYSKFARWREEFKRRETWSECNDRVFDFFATIPQFQLLGQEEKDWLRSKMLSLQASPAMRVVQMAGPALARCHMGAYNCLTAEAQFITKLGVRSFSDFNDGDEVEVLSHTGAWRRATVRNYGDGFVRKIALVRGRTKHEVRATDNHRWILADGTVTESLKVGDRLVRPPAPFAAWNYNNAEPDEKLYWAYGFAYGDGTLVKKGGEYRHSMVRLCGDKTKYLERFTELGFSHSLPPSCNGEPVVYTGQYLQDLPSLADRDIRLVRAFVRGYLDADGCKNHNPGTPNPFVSVQATGDETIDFIRNVFPTVGVYINCEKDLTEQETNYGKRSATTAFFSLLQNTGESVGNSAFVVKEISTEREMASLWCLEVDEDRSFVMPSGVVTGNCTFHPIIDLFAFAELLYILMQGSGSGFSVESDYIGELPRVKKQKKNGSAVVHNYTIEDSTEGWCEALLFGLQTWFAGEDAVFDYSRIRPAGARLKTKGGRACLTGDTVVYKDKKKTTGQNTLTVAELYEKRLNTPKRLRHIKIRCLDETTGTFQRNRVVDVIDNGVADVYEVKTDNGYRIKATANHRFMDKDAIYRHLDTFSVGDLIAVNGSTTQAGLCEECGSITHCRSTRCKACFAANPCCLDCGIAIEHRASRCRDCREKAGRCCNCGIVISRRADRCRNCADAMQVCPDALPTTARARKACQSQNSGVCSLCSRDDVDTQVHHKDRNPHNNTAENLLTLCEPCHRRLHAAEDTFGNPYSHRYLSFDRIVSVEYVGRERVYDLCMEAPNHNFVANGFVSHNSGPGPLQDLLDFTRKIILGAQGRQLMDIEVHDICCMIGKIVQVGGVRRASCISLSDLDSTQMRLAKHGAWWERNGQRSMANNSAVYQDERPSIEVFTEEFLALMKSGSGERGLFNRLAAQIHKPARRKSWKFGCNPCAEINLRPFQCCNLSIVVLRGDESIEEMENRIKAATYFGVLQSCCTNFRFVRKEWKQNCEEERLLGVDIMGHLDHPLLKPGAPGRDALVTRLKQVVHDTAESLSTRFGINMSAANTCLKPGGDSGVFFDTTSLAPYYSQYAIRRTREAVHSPLCQMLKDQGVPWEPAAEDEAGLVAFAWPKKNRDGCITREHMNAIEQLENWLFWKQHWAEHSCSVTIYVKPDEWLKVAAWVWDHFDEISGLSFLPWDNGTYRTAPNEALTEEQYAEMVKTFPTVDWSQLLHYELEDMTTSTQTFACTAGGCSLT